MTSNHLPPEVRISPRVLAIFGAMTPNSTYGQGFGLGFAVRTETGRNPLPGSPGEYYWTGGTGTAFWIDPKESLIAVMMLQIPFVAFGHYYALMRNLVYQAIVA